MFSCYVRLETRGKTTSLVVPVDQRNVVVNGSLEICPQSMNRNTPLTGTTCYSFFLSLPSFPFFFFLFTHASACFSILPTPRRAFPIIYMVTRPPWGFRAYLFVVACRHSFLHLRFFLRLALASSDTEFMSLNDSFSKTSPLTPLVSRSAVISSVARYCTATIPRFSRSAR